MDNLLTTPLNKCSLLKEELDIIETSEVEVSTNCEHVDNFVDN